MSTFINYDDPFNYDDPTVKRIIDRMIAINRKLLPQDCQGSTLLRTIATWYAHQYNGTFEYMQSMHRNVQRFTLSASQIAGTLNCMYNDYKHAQRRAASTFKMPLEDLPDLDSRLAEATKPVDISDGPHYTAETIEQVVLNGTYTVVLNETGDYRTIRLVDAPESMSKPQGTQIAQYLSGADNESSYTGFAFVSGTRVGMWSKFKADSKLAKALETLLTADRQRQIDMGESYAIESNNCWRCGRRLTVPASVSRGLGPICAEKLGL